MSPAPDPLRKHLNPEESLTAEFTATLSESAYRTPAVVGITDRRLLCTTDDNGTVSIGYNSICAIRSYSRTKRTYHGVDYGLLVGAGGLVALVGLVGILTLSTSPLVPLLALLGIGGVAVTEYLRRYPGLIEGELPTRLKRIATDLDEQYGVQESGARLVDRLGERGSLLVGTVFAGLFAYLGVVLFTPDILLSFFVLLVVGGVAAVDYAYRHREEFDRIEVVAQPTTEVDIRTNAGTTIHLTTDTSEDIGRELNRLVYADRFESERDVSLPTY